MKSEPDHDRKRRFKDDTYRAVARVPAALANRHRLELLDLLAQRPRTVQDVARDIGISVANASQHLQVLARSGLAAVERRGTFAYYRIANAAVSRLLVELRAVAETVDERIVDAERAYFGTREPGITSFSEAQRLIADPHTVLLDARPREEFENAHLPGAQSAPVELLHAHREQFTRSRRYLIYCRGPACIFADEAVEVLREHGFEAARLALGPTEWIAAGGTVERVG